MPKPIWSSLWWVLLAIVIIATVYEYDARFGGLLILLAVFGMLFYAQDVNGQRVLNFPSPTSSR